MSQNESWESLSRALDHALDLAEPERAAWLAQLAADNPDLAARLTAILDGSAAVQQQRFLDGDVSAAAVQMASPDLAEDIRRYLAHEPVSARRPTLAYRASRFVRRNRLGVAMASSAVLAVVAAMVTALIQ